MAWIIKKINSNFAFQIENGKKSLVPNYWNQMIIMFY